MNVLTALRFSCAEAKLARVGLKQIVAAHKFYERHGQTPGMHLNSLYPGPRPDGGKYNQQDMSVLRRALIKLEAVSGGSKRLQMDPFELAACALGARVTATQVQHGHLKAWRVDHKAATKKLLAKLERYRKQGKRAFIRIRGRKNYTKEHRQWEQFVRWVRANLVYCRCGRARFPGLKRRREMILNDWMESAHRELPGFGLEVPSESELRDLVRRALRSARRLQRRLSLRNHTENRAMLNDHIWAFIARRCRVSS